MGIITLVLSQQYEYLIRKLKNCIVAAKIQTIVERSSCISNRARELLEKRKEVKGENTLNRIKFYKQKCKVKLKEDYENDWITTCENKEEVRTAFKNARRKCNRKRGLQEGWYQHNWSMNIWKMQAFSYYDLYLKNSHVQTLTFR